jgi:hypothetical protein
MHGPLKVKKEHYIFIHRNECPFYCPKHVEFYSKNKSEKLLHLVGFIIRIYHNARFSECQKRTLYIYSPKLMSILLVYLCILLSILHQPISFVCAYIIATYSAGTDENSEGPPKCKSAPHVNSHARNKPK